MKKAFCFGFLLPVLFAYSLSVQAQAVLPSTEFITLKGPHFDLIIDAKHQAEGEFYYRKILKAEKFLQNYFTYAPGKTVIIINDRTDLTNGYATKVPYSHIMLFPVLPGPLESLGEPGDWALELLTHEYTHILTFEPATGAVKYLRYVFGSVMSPNILLPTWWKEGVAVHMESMVSTGGRLRSTYQDSMIRSFVLDQKLHDFDIAKANEPLPTWPEGQRPYLFGSIFWSQTAAEFGQNIVTNLHNRHGGRMPYFIQTPARDLMGRSYDDQYEKALAETQKRANDQILALKASEPTTDEELSFPKFEFAQLPSISADGEYMAVITKDDIDKRRLRVFKRGEGKLDFRDPTELPLKISQDEEKPDKKVFDEPPGGTIARSEWFHHKQVLVYDKVDSVNSVESLSDLYLLDLSEMRVKRLTVGARAREASVSPDDKQLVFVGLGMSKTNLQILNLETNKIEVLAEKPLQHRIAFPTFLNDRQIIYSVATPEGKENLEIYNLDTKLTSAVPFTLPEGKNRLPSQTTEGTFFISNANGVNNIYQFVPAVGKTPAKIRAVTHALTGYMSASIDPKTSDIYATKITSRGPQVVRIEKAKWQNPPASLPKISGIFADRYPIQDGSIGEDETMPLTDVEIAPYSSAGYLWPRYWIPFFNFTSNGWSIDAMTSGHDPLQRHNYSLAVGWESELQRMAWNVSYLNMSFDWGIFLQSARTNTYLINKSSYLSTDAWAVGLVENLFGIHRDLNVVIGATSQKFEVPADRLERKGSFIQTTLGKLSQAGMQISPESDQSYFLKVSHFNMNERFPVHTQTLGSANLYVSSFLPERHSIMFKVSGAYTQEPIAARYGVSSVTYSSVADAPAPQFVMRGYLSGHFIGKTAINPQLEYRFPIREINRGAGSDPLFLRRLSGAVVHDGMMVDGFAYRRASESYVRDNFNGYYSNMGAELRMDSVVGYVLPIKFILGHYIPLDVNAGGDSQTGFSLQINQFF
ncbi:MAG: hypothetical protein V4736_05185 [Bdellovibrionota bacterium]